MPRMSFVAALFVAAAVGAPVAAQPALTLEVPAAPGQGYTIRGYGFAPGSWVWIDVNDATDGSLPVHGPDAFQPGWDGTFLRAGASALPCGHGFQAVAFVDDQVAAVSSVVTPGCARPPALTLSVPNGPAAGFAVTGSGFEPGSWIWVTVEDTTDGSKPVDGPDAFQPDADGAFARNGGTALTCGHSFVSRAWVADAVAATSEPVTPACAPAGPSIALTFPAAGSYAVTGRGFDAGSWIWVTVEDTTDGTKPVDGPDAFQPDATGAFTRSAAAGLPCGHGFTAKAWVLDAVAATAGGVTAACAAGGNPAADGVTADPAATDGSRNVLGYLRSAPGRADHRLVVGQALRGWDFDAPLDEPVTALTNAGLPAPKLLEVDVTDFGVTPEHDRQLYAVLFDHVARGGLVGLSFHANNPFTGGSVYDRGNVNLFELSDPSNPQTWAGWSWRAELDQAAEVLLALRDAGAVVFFRPLHESNGEWFWWGQADPAAFRAAWKGTFDYLVNARGSTTCSGSTRQTATSAAPSTTRPASTPETTWWTWSVSTSTTTTCRTPSRASRATRPWSRSASRSPLPSTGRPAGTTAPPSWPTPR